MAIFERYVTIDGSSANGGTSFADSWDIVTAAASTLQNKRVNVRHHSLLSDGSASGASAYTVGNGLPDAEVLIGTQNSMWVGLDSSDNPISQLGTGPKLDAATATHSGAILRLAGSFNLAYGFTLANGPNYGLWDVTGSFHVTCMNTIENCAGDGIRIQGAYGAALFNKCTGNNNGIAQANGGVGLVVGNWLTGNTNQNLAGTSSVWGMLNLIDEAGVSSRSTIGNYGIAAYNTFINIATDPSISGGTYSTFINNIVEDAGSVATYGIDFTSARVLLQNIVTGFPNFYDTARNVAVAQLFDGTDPGVSSTTFEVTNDVRTGKDLGGFLNDTNIGGWQGGSGGGGGGGGIPVIGGNIIQSVRRA